MKLGDESKFKLVEAQLRSFIPGIRSIRIAKAEVKRKETDYQTIEGKEYSREVERSYSGESLLFDFDHATGVPAGSVSDGTLFLLGLLTVMHGNGNVRTILVDDLGDGLHPTAQRELIRLLKAFVETSGVQVIATSHSPFVLDDLTGDQVVLASLDQNGESVFGKMNSHPDFDRWKNEMTPGEYWTMIGEKWVTQGSGENSDAADIGVELER